MRRREPTDGATDPLSPSPPDAGPAAARPSALDLVESELAEADPDRYAAARAAPAAVRRDLLTLYAFNLELARIPWRVSEPQLGAVRLQWWADLAHAAAAGERAGGATQGGGGGPLAARVAEWVGRRRPPPTPLRAMIEARLRDLDPTPMESAEALDAFLAGSAGGCMRLAVGVATGRDDPAEAAAAADLGRANGAAALIAATPAYAARDRVMLPPPGGVPIPLDGLARGALSEAAREAVRRLARSGLLKLAAARARRDAVAPSAAPATLSAWRAEALLKRALKPDFDLVVDCAPVSPFRRRAGLLWRSILGW